MKPRRIQLGLGIGRGLYEGEFAHLDERTKVKLMTLMSRISEASFRRGLQQGEYFTRESVKLWIDPTRLRFDRSLDSSPMACTKGPKMTATDRLQIEHGGTLSALGFPFVKGWWLL